MLVVGPRPIRGVVGRIDWGYFAAAAINGYTVRRLADGGWDLRGTVVSFDAFKIRQRPLVFIAPHKDRVVGPKGDVVEREGEWRWPVRTVDLGPGQGPRELRATLGAQLPEMISSTR